MKDYFETSSTCLTGGYPHPLKEFPLHNMRMSTPTYNWQYHQLYQSRMISPSERRDSGVHSISDGQASSPSSDESERYPSIPLQNSPQNAFYYQNRFLEESRNSQNSSFISSPSPIKDEHNKDDEKGKSTPPPPDYSKENSALQNLQMSVEKNLNISSPEPANQEENANENNNNNNEENQEDYSVPTLNSHGKVKMVKCKQCKSIFKTKLEFWTHQREHIKPERLLECEKCPFVTEYKHHLEYHLRNHGGEKPFKCDRCDYKCVNKSMLNSHMKSHSSVYQYRCATCIYNSKYCHSLKLHLRKYGHEPAMVLNPDGTPNPLPIIDVYGTRRGPKVRTSSADEESNISSPKRIKTESSPPNPQMIPQIVPGMPDMSHFQLMAQDREMQLKLMFQQALLMQTLRMMNQGPGFVNNAAPDSNDSSSPTQENTGYDEENSVLDLSKERTTEMNNSSNIELKMDTPSTSDDEDEERMNLLYNVKVEHDVDDESTERPGGPTPPAESSSPTSCAESLRCPHCCITFDDIALFTIHMRFHNFSDPFTCNSCGQKCQNKIEFTVHIFSKPH